MGADTAIEWCHHTFNPWWGCVKVSEACRNCYAASTATRYGHDVWGPTARRRFFGDKHWNEPRKWNSSAALRGVRERVFCASMADVFEDLPREHLDRDAMLVARARLSELVCATPSLDWLLLTKRPENVRNLWPMFALPENVWIGTTAETQADAARRIPHLLIVPATVHFVSAEPLLEPVDLTDFLYERAWDSTMLLGGAPQRRIPALDWVIVGGESGHGSRPMREEWVASLRDQCGSAGVKFFFKQKIVDRRKVSLPVLDGRQWAEFPEVRA